VTRKIGQVEKDFRPDFPQPVKTPFNELRRLWFEGICHQHDTKNKKGDCTMRTLILVVSIVAFSTMGFYVVAQAGETSATMEKAKGETKALVEEGKGQAKGAVEDVKGNKMSAEAERAKGKAKAEVERGKGKANEMKEKAK
jgi:hypothetical protein